MMSHPSSAVWTDEEEDECYSVHTGSGPVATGRLPAG